MRTAAYNDDVASVCASLRSLLSATGTQQRRRRQNVPWHILCSFHIKMRNIQEKRIFFTSPGIIIEKEVAEWKIVDWIVPQLLSQQ